MNIWIWIGIATLLFLSVASWRGVRPSPNGDPAAGRQLALLLLFVLAILGGICYFYTLCTSMVSEFTMTCGRPDAMYIRAIVPVNGNPEAILMVNPSPQTLTTIEARGSWTPISRLEALRLFIEIGLRSD